MQSGESIYNLIPQPEVVPARPPMHKSKHPGEVDPRDFGMEAKRANATFGRSPGSLKPKTTEFLRKTNPEDTLRSRASNGPPDLPPGPAPRELPNLDAFRTSREAPLDHAPRAVPPSVDAHAHADRATDARRSTPIPRRVAPPPPSLTLPPPPSLPIVPDATVSSTARRRDKTVTKPPVPKATERPVMGLVSQKNFVTANAIENILAKPPKREEPLRATQKRDYGKVPKYLQTIKAQIAAEREMIAEYHRQQEEAEHGSARAMSEEERDELLVELKMKWAKLNRAYGGLSFSLDVPSHQRKKEQLEQEMTQLEKDIKMLQGRQVVVVEDGR